MTQPKERTREDLEIILKDLRRGELNISVTEYFLRTCETAGIPVGDTASVVCHLGMQDLRHALEYVAKGGDIYDSLMHRAKKVVSCELSGALNPMLTDFFQTMLHVGRSAGDPWLMSDAQRHLRGRNFYERFVARLEMIGGKTRAEYHRTGENFFTRARIRGRDPRRVASVKEVVRGFVDRHADFSFDSETYRLEKIGEIEQYLGSN